MHNTLHPFNCVVRMRGLPGLVGLSKSEIYRRIHAGTFPKPISLGIRAVGWLESDIQSWINSQAGRDPA